MNLPREKRCTRAQPNLVGEAERITELCKTMHPVQQGITFPADAPQGALVPVPGVPLEHAAALATVKDTGSAPVPQRYHSAGSSRHGNSQDLRSPSQP